MRHTPIAQSMGEGHGGLYEIIYLQDNRAQTPVVIVENISHKWAVRLVAAYNAQPALLEALESELENVQTLLDFATLDAKIGGILHVMAGELGAAIAKARP
ncbi:hypothetical protein LCGC14_2709430 [marine sediment metagenome]|uniref:Uncharacterized protein n=1 Tax=marine sediment metagenome TaxID=412755 RepID=A0A0F8ZDE4_9ZZZZ